jgi:hypothetical protein
VLDHKVPIYASVVGDLDPRTPFGRAIAAIIGILAELESIIKRERTTCVHSNQLPNALNCKRHLHSQRELSNLLAGRIMTRSSPVSSYTRSDPSQ